MKSMTGFGRSSNRQGASSAQSSPKRKSGQKTSGRSAPQETKAKPGAELDVSVRAVNGRFLEIRFHLPREYAPLESEFKKTLSRVFARGTIDIYINRNRVGTAANVAVNLELAKNWFDGYRELAKTLKLKSEPNLELLSKIPDVFQVQDQSEVAEEEKSVVFALLEQAAQSCDQERMREGKALQAELASLCARLEALAEKMAELKGEANAELERRLRTRLDENLQKLGFEGKVDDQRLAQELVIYLDRADVSEELQRLKEHLKAYQQLLLSSEPQGKKLDFYAQELLREVNTIGSKSHIGKLTSLVVEAKTFVEKIREQVQNVE